MPSKIWRGYISFGLVNIPVSLMSAQEHERVHFKMLDRRDYSPIGYKTINKTTGKEVPRNKIIKGYEYDSDRFIVLTDEDFKVANPKATQTIEIEDFVDAEDIDPIFFDRPYFIVFEKGGEKGYRLLRDALKKTGKAGIAKVVIRTRQYLAAIFAKESYLILELLRFEHEVLEIHEAGYLPTGKSGHETKPSVRELKTAEVLINQMSSKWNPKKYVDTYQRDLMRLIENRAKRGRFNEPPPRSERGETKRVQGSRVVDLMPLLKKSLEAKKQKKAG